MTDADRLAADIAARRADPEFRARLDERKAQDRHILDGLTGTPPDPLRVATGDDDPRKVAGYCPMGCGETLFLEHDGRVTCSYIACPNPHAVADLLAARPGP